MTTYGTRSIVSTTLFAGALPRVDPCSAHGLRGPIGAFAGPIRIRKSGIDETGTADMRRVMSAVVIVRIVVGEIARCYRQNRPRSADTIFDLDHVGHCSFA